MYSKSPDLPKSFLEIPLAHRGLHDMSRDIVENSRASFVAAIDAGYGVELDIQASADDTPMVFHDKSLSRMTRDSGMVQELTASELRNIQLVAGGEAIPTLREILDLIAGRAPILMEIKSLADDREDHSGRLEENIARELEGYPGHVAIMSFNPHIVKNVSKTLPGLPRGLTSQAYELYAPQLSEKTRRDLGTLNHFDDIGASFVSHDRRDLDNPSLRALKARGVPILTWTIYTAAQEEEARRIADNITFESYRPASSY